VVKKAVDVDALLAPIAGENPAGENLRYTPTYDEIQEARRADDPHDRGEWQRELKTADWDRVIAVAVEALATRSKDLQIAAWLTEALTLTEGFGGLAAGLKVLAGLLRDFWDHVYPEVEEGDLEFRAGPIEFLNEKLPVCVKQISLTDSKKTPGYSWLAWQESRRVGYDKDILNQWGDVDEGKKKARDELIAEGKITAETFDAAVTKSSRSFYESTAENVAAARQEFETLDRLMDEKFGREAPRVAELRTTFEECEQLVNKLVKEKGGREPAAKRAADKPPKPEGGEAATPREPKEEQAAGGALPSAVVAAAPTAPIPQFPATRVSDSDSMERSLWASALETLNTDGMVKALEQLFAASCNAPSAREKNRYRLLMAKICLKAGRPDLARPIVEELHNAIEELHLERWESPVWIGEVLEALYQCLTAGPETADATRAGELFQKLCITDVTKAMLYKQGSTQ
jgi:type VI secretion system protein ImpA